MTIERKIVHILRFVGFTAVFWSIAIGQFDWHDPEFGKPHIASQFLMVGFTLLLAFFTLISAGLSDRWGLGKKNVRKNESFRLRFGSPLEVIEGFCLGTALIFTWSWYRAILADSFIFAIISYSGFAVVLTLDLATRWKRKDKSGE